VLSGSEDGHIFVWDLLDGTVLHRLRHTQPSGTAQPNPLQSASSAAKKEVVSAVAFCGVRKEWASAGGDGESLFFFFLLFLFLRRGGGWFRREGKGRERLGHEMNRR
jgi:mitogen-activated protein kinase organizer 1